MKNKSILVLIMLFLLPSVSQAQVFSEVIVNNTIVNAQKSGLASTSNSILTGLTKIDVPDNFRESIQLIMVAHNGNLQESLLYSSLDNTASINCQQIIPVSENTILISGTYRFYSGLSFPFIMSVNSSGIINWAKKIDVPSDHSPDLTVLSDDSILCIVKYSNGQTQQVFCKIDGTGNLSSFFEINDPFKIKKDILINTSSFDILFNDGTFLNIDNNLFSVNWQKKYQNTIGVAINKTANSDYISATCQVAFPGYMTITRTNNEGIVLWCKYLESWTGPIQNQGTYFDVTGIHSIKEDVSGNIIVYGNSEGGGNGTFQVTLDANGGYVSNYKTTSYFNLIRAYGTDELLLLAYSNAGSFNTSNIILQKIKNDTFTTCDIVLSYSIADGNQIMSAPESIFFTPTSTITTTAVSLQKTDIPTVINQYCEIPLSVETFLKQPEIQIFPIPSSNSIEIKMDDAFKEVIIYDAMGKLLMKTQQSKINISTMPDGVYIVIVKGAEKTFIRKIIKN